MRQGISIIVLSRWEKVSLCFLVSEKIIIILKKQKAKEIAVTLWDSGKGGVQTKFKKSLEIFFLSLKHKMKKKIGISSVSFLHLSFGNLQLQLAIP